MSSERSIGRSGVGPNYQPKLSYLLDNCLNPRLAEALRLAGWNVQSVHEVFACKPTDSIPDQEIIPYCANEGRVWITADDAARREHEVALKQHLVSVLWVRRPAKGGMSTAFQHAHLATALLRVDEKLSRKRNKAMHCRLSPALNAQPQDIWNEKNSMKSNAPRAKTSRVKPFTGTS